MMSRKNIWIFVLILAISIGLLTISEGVCDNNSYVNNQYINPMYPLNWLNDLTILNYIWGLNYTYVEEAYKVEEDEYYPTDDGAILNYIWGLNYTYVEEAYKVEEDEYYPTDDGAILNYILGP